MRKGIYRYKKNEKGQYLLMIWLMVVLFLTPKSVMQSTKLFHPVSRQQLVEVIRQNHSSPKLVKAIIQVESRWNSAAVSSKGAIGLMQVLPSSAKPYGFSRIDLFCPVKNIQAGTAILKDYQKETRSLRIALARYSGRAGGYYEKVMKEM